MATIKSVEEKAKAYDEALEKARQLCAYPTTKPFISDLQDLFPELKESEDERIMENIIATIHLYYGEPLEDEAKEMVAWLEKQGEQKPVEWSEEDDSILKEIIDSVTACDATTGTILVCFEKHEAKVRWLKSLKERFNK